MLALSVALGAKAYSEERSLSAKEAKFVEKLKRDTLQLVAENKKFVNSQVGNNFIGVSILALCFKNPLSN